jgi:two-component system OmpR family response regulator
LRASASNGRHAGKTLSASYLEDPKGLTVQRRTQQLDRAPVLVVEDEPDLAEEIRLELEADGHPVRLAASAAEALSAARAGWATVIVFDRMLQRDDGLSVVETLRSEGVATPVLVISALSSVDERIRGLKAGGDDYLIKPFAVRELTARVDALLRRRGACRDGSDSWS